MDTAQEILFDGFPRTVAWTEGDSLRQSFIHSSSSFDLFFETNRDKSNLYASTCRFREDMRHILPLVFFDFDSSMKESVFDGDTEDREKVTMMRENEQLAEEVLGSVWSDVQSLIGRCIDKEIPVVSVFSGLGVHCHLLYQERVQPVQEKVSISNYFIDESDLDTWDRQVITDTRRVLRIPNSQRIDDSDADDVWCIPITEQEVLNNSIHDLLQRCKKPKGIPYHDRYKQENRPEMEVKEGYEDVDEETTGTIQLQESAAEVDGLSVWIVDNCIPMPCVRERFKSQNPDHRIRLSGACSLFQAGFEPKEVQKIIVGLGWVDYDANKTMKFLKQAWSRKYSEFSCSALKSHGLCVYGPDFDDRSDDPSDCETYKYKSGEALYPYEQ